MDTKNESAKLFKSTKDEVQLLITKNLFREVTSETNFKVSGIYMIYIDHWSNDKIIPIYIGQAKDIQRRYQNHLMEILALNRLSYGEYEKYFFKRKGSLYEGSFKASKIFKFMVENNCVLSHFRMVILEESLKEDLDKKEEEYFKRLLPSYLGFNQLNSMLTYKMLNRSRKDMENKLFYKFLDELLLDIYYIGLFYNYGFTRFNFEYSMTKDIDLLVNTRSDLSEEALSKVDEIRIVLKNLIDDYLPGYTKERIITKEKSVLLKKHLKSSEDFYLILEDLKYKLKEKFEQLNFDSIKAQENFLNSVLNGKKVEYKNRFIEYMNLKKFNIDFYRLYDKEIRELKLKHTLYKENRITFEEADILYKEMINRKLTENYEMIFPENLFESFSLKDYPKNLSIVLNDKYFLGNTCHLRIYISNYTRARKDIYKDPDIIKIDYLYIDYEVNKVENSYYIKNFTTENCQKGNHYVESDFYIFAKVAKEPFKLSTLYYDELDDSFISVVSEYKHGMNDYTLMEEELYDLEKVFDEIRATIDDKTRFDVKIIGTYPSLDKSLKPNLINRDAFIDRLVSKKLPKLKKKNREN